MQLVTSRIYLFKLDQALHAAVWRGLVFSDVKAVFLELTRPLYVLYIFIFYKLVKKEFNIMLIQLIFI